MELSNVKSEVWQRLVQPTPPKIVSFEKVILGDHRFFKAEVNPPQIRPRFSVFNLEDCIKAAEVYDYFFKLADSAEGIKQSLEKVVSAYDELKEKTDPELLDYALMVFISHHKYGKFISIPSILLREPEKVLPSKPPENSLEKDTASAQNAESVLNWYREDPLYNEHHEHWHIVYPFLGLEQIKDDKIERTSRDRQGEIFMYMHRQMLARYDSERIALNMPRVMPLDDFKQPLKYGYDPGRFIDETFPYFGKRLPNTLLSDISRVMYRKDWDEDPAKFTYTIERHETIRSQIEEAIESGFVLKENKKWALDVNLLGLTIEASPHASPDIGLYGSYHNDGHRLIAVCNDPDGTKGEPEGVMARPETSIRDSVFFEWHKHIDNFYKRWQEKQPLQTFNDSPLVQLRKGLDEADKHWSPDIIICKRAEVGAILATGIDLQTLADKAFGGANWFTDFTAATAGFGNLKTYSALETFMQDGEIAPQGIDPVPYRFLNHAPYVFFFRVKNSLPITQEITLRLFLVPEGYEEDMTMYIELDKFKHTLQKNQDTVIARSDTDFSIVRKPAVLLPQQPLNYSPDFDYLIGGDFIKPADRLIPNQYYQQLIKFYTSLKKYRVEWLNSETLYFIKREFDLEQQIEDLQHDLSNASLNELEKSILSYRQKIQDVSLDRAYCSCGWPYNLLYPRGTPQGMNFKLVLIISDWDKDKLDDDSCCTSLSFCGAKDRYPDARPMGYPFNSRYELPIIDTLVALKNTAIRTINIKYVQ